MKHPLHQPSAWSHDWYHDFDPDRDRNPGPDRDPDSDQDRDPGPYKGSDQGPYKGSDQGRDHDQDQDWTPSMAIVISGPSAICVPTERHP